MQRAWVILSSVACRFYNISPHNFINGKNIKKKIIEHTMCVLIFCTTLSRTFLIIRKIQWNMIKMCIGLYVKYTLFLSDSNENWIFETDFRKKYSNIKFHENLSNGNLIFACMQTDRQTDMMKLIITCRNFLNLSTMRKLIKLCQISVCVAQF